MAHMPPQTNPEQPTTLGNIEQAIMSLVAATLGNKGQIFSQANAGSGGGTIYYLTLGSLKIAFGTCTAGTISSSSPQAVFVTYPTSFFSAVPTVMMTPTALAGSANIAGEVDNLSITGFRLVYTPISVTCTPGGCWIAVGQ